MSATTVNDGLLHFTDENGTEKAILGTLEGPCADFLAPTRNGRLYNDELWGEVFEKNPIVNEMFENGGIVGELDHPANYNSEGVDDREESDTQRTAILLKEKPVKKDGKYWAKFSILNTPLGKIAYTLAKAGFKFGVSSRGSGDVLTNENGEEYVDPLTYDFKAFDLVLLPAVKSARLSLVTESLDTKKSDFRKELNEQINSSDDKDKKLIMETLNHLGIRYQPTKKVVNIEGKNEQEEVVNDKSDVVSQLQEVLLNNQKLEKEITTLQEKLSVCYAKESHSEEVIEKYKTSIQKLTESLKIAKVESLKIPKLQTELTSVKSLLNEKVSAIKTLNEKLKANVTNKKALNESIAQKQDDCNKLTDRVRSLSESLKATKIKAKEETDALNEQLEDMRKDASIKKKEYSDKLKQANSLVEKYKSVAKTVVNEYIGTQAKMIGASPTEITNKLPANYSLNDITTVCESLRNQKIAINKLPFDTRRMSSAKISVKESVSPNTITCSDDMVDETLLSFIQ